MQRGPVMRTSSDELLWVNVHNPTDIKDAGVMKQIRSHTQREVRRKERIGKPKPSASNKQYSKHMDRCPVVQVKEISVSPKPLEEPIKEEPIKEEPSKEIVARTELHRTLQNLAADASCTSPSLGFPVSPRDPVRLNQMIYRYLSAWHGERAPKICGGEAHGRWESWMPAVITNDTMMYAQAFCAALHFQFWGRQSTSTNTWALKNQAVMRVYKNLHDPDFALSDSNVASVLCLAFASHVEDSGKENCMTHMYGLQKIIVMRGGWESILSNELLSDLLAMADFLSAIIFKTRLIYTPRDKRQQQHTVHESLRSPLGAPGLFSAQREQLDLSAEAFRTLDNMQNLTEMFEQLDNFASTPIFDTTKMEESFKHLRPSSSPGKHSDRISENVHESIRLTGIIYYRAIVCNTPFSDTDNLEDALRLKTAVEATVLTGWTNIPGALLWVLLVGTAALRGLPEGFIISGHLSTSVLCVGVRHWLPVRRLLERFCSLEEVVERNANRMVRQLSESRRTSDTSDSDDVNTPILEGEVFGITGEEPIHGKGLGAQNGNQQEFSECKIYYDCDGGDDLSVLEGEVIGMLM